MNRETTKTFVLLGKLAVMISFLYVGNHMIWSAGDVTEIEIRVIGIYFVVVASFYALKSIIKIGSGGDGI